MFLCQALYPVSVAENFVILLRPLNLVSQNLQLGVSVAENFVILLRPRQIKLKREG